MTSNVGTRALKDFGTGVGFGTKAKNESIDKDSKDILTKELKKRFPPEFINRIDDIIYFNDLSKENIEKIVTIEINKSLKRLNEIGYQGVINESLIEKLIEVGYQPEYGARPMKRAIQKWVDDYITEFIIESDPKIGSSFIISYDKELDKTKIEVEKLKKASRNKKEEL